jgi:demethylmenaquinone methyltransferase/2-methoxy-6-polyprenyl-1,4-benzoquinol methylase
VSGAAEAPAGWRDPPAAPTPPERRRVGELFRWLAPEYDRALNAYSLGQDLRWKAVLVRGLRPRRGDRALDLACGTGLISERLARAVGSASVVGVDINRNMLLAGARGDRALVQADAQRLPFADRTFDIVSAGYLLKYVRLERFVPELRRILRPGGRFGGYDFSRPRRGTATGRLYSVYLHDVLPGLGRALRPEDPGWESLFEFLGNVAERSGWEERIAGVFAEEGFERVRVRPSLGGAVSWVWASRPEDLGSVRR